MMSHVSIPFVYLFYIFVVLVFLVGVFVVLSALIRGTGGTFTSLAPQNIPKKVSKIIQFSRVLVFFLHVFFLQITRGRRP